MMASTRPIEAVSKSRVASDKSSSRLDLTWAAVLRIS